MVFALWFWFECKHLLADWIFQTTYMVVGKGKRTGWILPLSFHCGWHALGTALILLLLVPERVTHLESDGTEVVRVLTLAGKLLLVCLDFVIHFGMDRVKSSPNMLGKFKYICDYVNATKSEKLGDFIFWKTLGIDQFVHHLTNLLIVWLAVG